MSEEPGYSEARGIVFNIQHFTIHDGPGIRTEVFLKGCALKCKWCSNPESIKSRQEIGIYPSRCIGTRKCGYCLDACPESIQGVLVQQDNRICAIDRSLCTHCLQCADVCPAEAIMVWGIRMSVPEVMKEIMADIDFYNSSGGGVTLSGGDPLVQWPFTLEILRQCRRQHIHTCLETELHCSSALLEQVYPFTDLVITDIKHMDTDRHREYTGVGNRLILENIKKTVEMKMPLILRIPVIPGHNDSVLNIRKTAEFIKENLNNRVLQVQLVPYRPLGIEKYDSLGIQYLLADFGLPDIMAQKNHLAHLEDLMKSYGIPAIVGSNEKISEKHMFNIEEYKDF